jgi:hypothetical protein
MINVPAGRACPRFLTKITMFSVLMIIVAAVGSQSYLTTQLATMFIDDVSLEKITESI